MLDDSDMGSNNSPPSPLPDRPRSRKFSSDPAKQEATILYVFWFCVVRNAALCDRFSKT